MFSVRTKFLWLPKKINGKWYWLKKVMMQTDYHHMNIGGKTTYVTRKKYYLVED